MLKFPSPNSESLLHEMEMRILVSVALRMSSFSKTDMPQSSKCLLSITGDTLSTEVYGVQDSAYLVHSPVSAC